MNIVWNRESQEEAKKKQRKRRRVFGYFGAEGNQGEVVKIFLWSFFKQGQINGRLFYAQVKTGGHWAGATTGYISFHMSWIDTMVESI